MLFGKKEQPVHPDLVERLAKFERELEQLRDEQKRSYRDLDADMDELYDKVKRALGRVSKRNAVDAPKDEEPAAPGAPRTNAEWNAEILRRRGNGLSRTG